MLSASTSDGDLKASNGAGILRRLYGHRVLVGDIGEEGRGY